MGRQFTLGRSERLKSRKRIEELFTSGKNFPLPPFRIHYATHSGEGAIQSPVQFGVTVGTRYFKKAVDRNRIKRLVREAYRLQKLPLNKLLEEKRIQLSVFFVYAAKDLPEFNFIKEKVALVLKKLEKLVNEIPGSTR
jgi:ribonuclease P protein component